MGRFWGTSPSQNDNRESAMASGNGDSNRPSGHDLPSDERTALLRDHHESEQQRNGGHHHLHPNDPAVTPYNLLSVRTLRWVSVLFLVLSFLWWLLLLIAMFIAPPGLSNRGGGWFAFAYTTFATGSLLALLILYGTPSKTERILWLTTLFFLLVDLIIILAAGGIRRTENWTGIVSAVWALFITAWCILCDRVVEYGKHEEQERLTGIRHLGHRRSFREWFSVFSGTTILTIFLIISVLFTISLSIRARDDSLEPLGEKYTIAGGHSIHVACFGNATDSKGNSVTTVLLEGDHEPVEGRLESWARQAHEQHDILRYCFWDRPGYGWSDVLPSPMSAGMAVDALSAALVKAGIDGGPWVLASHGVGGIYSRIFASRHVVEVKGLLLIDVLPESLLSRIGNPRRGFVSWLHGVLYPLGIDRLISAVFLNHNRYDRVAGKDAWQNGGEIMAKLQENLVAISFTRGEIDAARKILPKDIPIAVVSSGKMVKKSKEWDDGQRELTKLSDRLLAWDVVDGAPHAVWKDKKGQEVLTKRVVQLLNH